MHTILVRSSNPFFRSAYKSAGDAWGGSTIEPDRSFEFLFSLSLFLSFRGVIELQRYRQSRVINSRRKDVRSLVGNGVKMGQATHARYKPVVQRHSVRSYCPRARFTSSFFHFFFFLFSHPPPSLDHYSESNVFSTARSLFASVINMGTQLWSDTWGQVGAWILR